jgi:hypothetical protein
MKKECVCKKLKDTTSVKLLTKFNMHMLIEEAPNNKYKLVALSPNSGGLKDQGSVYITHCPLCGDKL